MIQVCVFSEFMYITIIGYTTQYEGIAEIMAPPEDRSKSKNIFPGEMTRKMIKAIIC
jgi:hypothetical protein